MLDAHVLQVALANSSQEIAFTKLLIENGLKLGAGPAVEEEQAAYAAELAAKVEEAAAEHAAASAAAAAVAAEAGAEEAPQVLDKSPSGFLMIEEEAGASGSEPEPEAEPAAEASERVEEGVPPD